MKHVQQRLLMHQLVLEDRVDGFAFIDVDVVARERALDQCIGFGAVGLHFVARWPDIGRALHARFAVGIDAALEDLFKVRMNPFASQRHLHERVHREDRQVAFVEHDRVAQRDRAVVVGVGRDDVEDLAGARARGAIPGDQRFAGDPSRERMEQHSRDSTHACAGSPTGTSTTRNGGRSGNAAASTGMATL